MSPRIFILSAAALFLPVLTAHADQLLSDNTSRTSAASYPGTTSKVASTGRLETGATYAYLTDAAAGTGVGNTDPEILKMDGNLTRLTDGYNERVGNTAIYGAWQGSLGATVVFDLKQPRNVSRVSVSVREDSNRGAATFQVFVSADGVAYAPLGTWDATKTPLDTAEADSGRNTELMIAAPAPVAARYVKIFLSHWDATRATRQYRQLVVGEVAIWGDRR